MKTSIEYRSRKRLKEMVQFTQNIQAVGVI